MIKKIIFLLSFLVSLASYAQEESKSIEQFVNELDKKIPQVLNDFIIPGAAIAIIEDGEIVLQKGYGFSDIEKGTKVDTKTGFNIGSISKTVAAWGVMKLVQEGKIDLDAPAETYLTRWKLPASEFDSDEVTVRRLLSHTAGLSISSVSAGIDYDNLPTLEDWLNGKNDGLGPVEIILEPGSKGEYSGGGYGVCQLIIEEVTGQKFEDYMQAQVLDPLGMTNSSYKIDDKIKAASASSYDRYGDATDFELFTVQSGAGLHTTLEDFTRFAFASLYQHQDNSTYNPVLTVDIIKQMMEPVPNTKRWAWSYGMGYQAVEMGPLSGYRGHGGTNIGWQANFWVDPVSNDGFVVFSNGGASNVADLVFCRWVTWKSGANPWGACDPKLSIASKLKQVIDNEGIEAISKTYATLKKEQPDEYDFSEGQLNDLAYYYKGKSDLEKAIAIFKINVDAFPYAFNVYDSYGEALLEHGAREEAIENYKKSVKLNPSNEKAIKVLNDLGVSTDDLMVKVPIEHLELLAGEYIMTYSPTWRMVFEVENGELVGKDGNYRFRLLPVGDNKFVNPDDGLSLVFDTEDPNAITLWHIGKYKFWRKGALKPGIARKLLNIIDSTGIDNIAAIYSDLKQHQPEKYDFSEWQLNALGYHYKGKGDLEKSKTIFKLNVDAFPDAFNVYDSYGEVLLEQGAKEEGIENYKKSVELNPGNEHGIKVLNDLGVSTDDLIVKVPIEHLKLLAGEYIMTNDEEWKLVFEVVNEELVGNDGDYRFRLFPSGDNEFIIPDDGASWVFDTKDKNEITLVFFGKYYFKKIK